MSGAPLGPVLRHVRRLAAIAEAGERTDHQLLADFATGRDEAAFSALVRRHGALVLGVCRQVLRHAEDAEDVFQATFLVLARKAGSIRSGEALAGWLHGVAYRLARNARRSATRRRAYERGAQPMSPKDPSWEVGWQEAQALVVDEVERLLPKYRLPFLLCHVEGQSRADAARQLGLKEATVRSRLARACKRLQECLARRGVTLVAVLAMGALEEGKGLAGVPARLASTTVRAALHYAGLRTAATAAASAQVVALANGLLRGMALAKLKSASVVLVGLGILAAGAGTAAQWLVPGQHAGHVASGHVEELGLASRAAASAVHPAPAADAVHVRGQVLDPDGQPHAGASIYLWTNAVPKNADLPVRATTGADGRFRLLVTALERAQGATVVARAPGHGPDWFEVPHSVKDPKVTFRLTKDDVPITGRIIDPEGRPIPGVTVEVRGLGHQADCGDLAAWVNRKVKEESQGRYLPEEGLDTVGVEAVNLRTAGLQVTAFPSLTGAYYENLPLEKFGFQGEEGYRLSLWYRLTRRQTTTDANGHFQLDGLVPGWPYQVFVSDGDLEEADTLLWARDGQVVGAARTMDLGDLHVETAGTGERADLLIPGKGPEGEEGRPGKRFWQIRWLYQPSEPKGDVPTPSDEDGRIGILMR